MSGSRTAGEQLVFCHACSEEFYKQGGNLDCPRCHSDFTELVGLSHPRQQEPQLSYRRIARHGGLRPAEHMRLPMAGSRHLVWGTGPAWDHHRRGSGFGSGLHGSSVRRPDFPVFRLRCRLALMSFADRTRLRPQSRHHIAIWGKSMGLRG